MIRLRYSFTLVLFLLGILFLSTIIASANLQQSTDRSQVNQNDNILVITAGEFRVAIHRMFRVHEVDGDIPSRDKDYFLLVDITIYNDSSHKECFDKYKFLVTIDEELLDSSKNNEARSEFFPGRDYPGRWGTYCIDHGKSDKSFLSYEILSDLTDLNFRFAPESSDIQAEVNLSLEIQENNEYLFTVRELKHGNVVSVTHTPTLTPTDIPTVTPSPSPTVTATPDLFEDNLSSVDGVVSIVRLDTTSHSQEITIEMEIEVENGYVTETTAETLYEIVLDDTLTRYEIEDLPIEFKLTLSDGALVYEYIYDSSTESWTNQKINTPTPTATSLPVVSLRQTHYINTTTINIRTGPSTNFSIAGQLRYGDSIAVTGLYENWYRIEFEGDVAWVFVPLTSKTRPSSGSGSGGGSTGGGSGTGGGSTGGSNPTSPPQAPCSCSGNLYNCSDGSFSTVSQAQTCYNYCLSQGVGDIHDLDRDNDGLACESGVS